MYSENDPWVATEVNTAVFGSEVYYYLRFLNLWKLINSHHYIDFLQDIEQLYNELGNPKELWRVPDKKWSHLDFGWGIDAPTVVYDPLSERLKMYDF